MKKVEPAFNTRVKGCYMVERQGVWLPLRPACRSISCILIFILFGLLILLPIQLFETSDAEAGAHFAPGTTAALPDELSDVRTYYQPIGRMLTREAPAEIKPPPSLLAAVTVDSCGCTRPISPSVQPHPPYFLERSQLSATNSLAPSSSGGRSIKWECKVRSRMYSLLVFVHLVSFRAYFILIRIGWANAAARSR